MTQRSTRRGIRITTNRTILADLKASLRAQRGQNVRRFRTRKAVR